jgi:hypothetical protein
MHIKLFRQLNAECAPNTHIHIHCHLVRQELETGGNFMALTAALCECGVNFAEIKSR